MQLLVGFLFEHPQYKDSIVNWHQTQWGQHYPDRTLSQWQDFVQLNMYILPIIMIAIDLEVNIPIGMVTLRNGDSKLFNSREILELAALYVIDAYREKGVATVLLNKACEQAMLMNFDEINLFTFGSGNVYRKNGWIESGVSLYKQKAAFFFRKELALKTADSQERNKLCGIL